MAARPALVVATLGLTQVLAWGASYYLPAIFADPVCAALHISRAWFFGVVSAALLLSGLLGPLAGRAIDRCGGRFVLALSNLVFASGLLLLAQANGLATLGAGWLVLGIGMALGLYEAAFAAVAGLYGQGARSAITGITLFGGFASTLGWPASAWLIEALGWRGACVAWAALHLAVGLPLHLLLVPRAAPPVAAPAASAGAQADPGAARAMIVLAGVFAATWFVSAAMAAHLPRLLAAMGASPSVALLAASLLGPAQVAARLLAFAVQRRASPLAVARLATLLHPLAAVALVLLGPLGAIPFVLLHGGGNGLLTIARGTLPLALFGAAGYGLRTGLIAAPARILQGGAPLLFALLLDHFGPLAALLVSFSLTAGSFVAVSLLRPARR